VSDDHKDEPSNIKVPVKSKRQVDYLFVFLLFLALLTALLALLVAAAVFLSALFGIPLTVLVPKQLLPSSNQLYAAAGLLLLLALIFFLLARWRIRRNRAYQFISGCPLCLQHDMIRVHRSQWHRISAELLQLPFRKYACRNCQWQGVLLYYPMEILRANGAGIPLPAQGAPMQNDEPEGSDKDLLIQSFAVPVTGNDLSLANTDPLPVDPGETIIQEQVLPLPVDDQQDPPEEETAPSEAFVDKAVYDDPLKQKTSVSDTVSKDRIPVGKSPDENAQVQPDHPKGSELRYPAGIISRAIVVSPFGLSIRTAPSNTAEIIMKLETDSVVEVFEIENQNAPINWRQVRYDGETGWVSAAFLRILQD
jgi:hypothetical protein